MKKSSIFVILVFLFTLQVNGSVKFGHSDSSKDSVEGINNNQRLGQSEKKNTIWVNVGQLAITELQVGFERQTMTDVSVEGTIGFKAPRNLGKPYTLKMRSIGPLNYYDYIALIPFSTGILANLSVKKYLNPEKDFYLSGGFFYRYWLYNHQHLDSYEMDYQSSNNFSSKQSLRMHVSGFKLLAGFIVERFTFTDNTEMVVDFYGGLSYRKKLVSKAEDPLYAVPDNFTQHAPELRRSENVAFQLGLKVGLNF